MRPPRGGMKASCRGLFRAGTRDLFSRQEETKEDILKSLWCVIDGERTFGMCEGLKSGPQLRELNFGQKEEKKFITVAKVKGGTSAHS